MGKKTKVTLDTNILISAFGWKGNPHKIFEMIISGEIELFLSFAQFEEFFRVLDYPKFGFTKEQKSVFRSVLSEVATFVDTTKTKLEIIKQDPSDNSILECALSAKVDFIISGDAHLLDIKSIEQTKIVTATQFLKRQS